MARAIHVFRTPDRFVAGTVGQPGNRTFYLQAVHDKRVVSVILEKQQVAVLAERIAALLLEINRRFGTPVPPETDVEDLSPLVTPVDAEFRVGTMGLGWDSEAETVVVELLAVSETEFDASVVLDDAEDGPDAVRVFLTPESARQFATRSNRVISGSAKHIASTSRSQGRPRCGISPTGHWQAANWLPTLSRMRSVGISCRTPSFATGRPDAACCSCGWTSRATRWAMSPNQVPTSSTSCPPDTSRPAFCRSCRR